LSFNEVPTDKLNDYFNSEEESLQAAQESEPVYELRVCDICLTPVCELCLPWDFATVKYSEIPLFFPNATENGDGTLKANIHEPRDKNCRCTLFPVSGYMIEEEGSENGEPVEMDGDIKDKVNALRNHHRAFNEEQNPYEIRAQQLMKKKEQNAQQDKETVENQQIDVSGKKIISKPLTEPKTAQTVFKFNILDKHSGYTPPTESEQLIQENKPYPFSGASAASAASAEPTKPPVLGQPIGSNTQGTLTLEENVEQGIMPKVDSQIAQKINIFAGKSEAQIMRQLWAFRSPMAAARLGTRTGLKLGGQIAEQEGIPGLASFAAGGGAAIATQLAFFIIIPQIEKLLKIMFDREIQAAVKKQIGIWDQDRQQSYRQIYRGLGVQG